MRLCEVLFLLCLCAASGLVAGQTLAIRRPHQRPRKVDRVPNIKDQPLGRVLAQNNSWPSKSPLGPKTGVVTPRTIASRKLVRRNTFCRPKSSGSVSGSKDSTQVSLAERGKWLHVLTSVAAVLLLYSS